MSTLTYKIEDAWLCPDGDGMMFCQEKDGLAFTELEADLETSGDEWNITEIRMVEPVPLLQRKVILTGFLRESAMDFIIDHHVIEIDKFVDENTGDDDDDGDDRCDALREEAA